MNLKFTKLFKPPQKTDCAVYDDDEDIYDDDDGETNSKSNEEIHENIPVVTKEEKFCKEDEHLGSCDKILPCKINKSCKLLKRLSTGNVIFYDISRIEKEVTQKDIPTPEEVYDDDEANGDFMDKSNSIKKDCSEDVNIYEGEDDKNESIKVCVLKNEEVPKKTKSLKSPILKNILSKNFLSPKFGKSKTYSENKDESGSFEIIKTENEEITVEDVYDDDEGNKIVSPEEEQAVEYVDGVKIDQLKKKNEALQTKSIFKNQLKKLEKTKANISHNLVNLVANKKDKSKSIERKGKIDEVSNPKVKEENQCEEIYDDDGQEEVVPCCSTNEVIPESKPECTQDNRGEECAKVEMCQNKTTHWKSSISYINKRIELLEAKRKIIARNMKMNANNIKNKIKKSSTSKNDIYDMDDDPEEQKKKPNDNIVTKEIYDEDTLDNTEEDQRSTSTRSIECEEIYEEEGEGTMEVILVSPNLRSSMTLVSDKIEQLKKERDRLSKSFEKDAGRCEENLQGENDALSDNIDNEDNYRDKMTDDNAVDPGFPLAKKSGKLDKVEGDFEDFKINETSIDSKHDNKLQSPVVQRSFTYFSKKLKQLEHKKDRLVERVIMKAADSPHLSNHTEEEETLNNLGKFRLEEVNFEKGEDDVIERSFNKDENNGKYGVKSEEISDITKANDKKKSHFSLKSTIKCVNKRKKEVELKGSKMKNVKEINPDIYDADEFVDDQMSEVGKEDEEECQNDIDDGDEPVETVSNVASVGSGENIKSPSTYLSRKIKQLEDKKDKFATSVIKKMSAVRDVAKNNRKKSEIEDKKAKADDQGGEDNLHGRSQESGNEIYDGGEIGVYSVSNETHNLSRQQTDPQDSVKVVKKSIKSVTSKARQSDSKKSTNHDNKCVKRGDGAMKRCPSQAEDEGDSVEALDDDITEDPITATYNLRNKLNKMSDNALKINGKENKVIVEVKVKPDENKKAKDVEYDIYDSDQHEDDVALSDNVDSIVEPEENIQKKSHLNIKSKFKYITKQMQKIESKGKIVAASLELRASQFKQQINDQLKDKNPKYEDIVKRDATGTTGVIDEIYDDDDREDIVNGDRHKGNKECDTYIIGTGLKMEDVVVEDDIVNEVYDSDENMNICQVQVKEVQCAGFGGDVEDIGDKKKSHFNVVSLKYINKQIQAMEIKRRNVTTNLEFTAQKIKQKISVRKDSPKDIYDADDAGEDECKEETNNTRVEMSSDTIEDPKVVTSCGYEGISSKTSKKNSIISNEYNDSEKVNIGHHKDPKKSSFNYFSEKIMQLKNPKERIKKDNEKCIQNKTGLFTSEKEQMENEDQDIYDDEDEDGERSGTNEQCEEIYDDEVNQEDCVSATLNIFKNDRGNKGNTKSKKEMKEINDDMTIDVALKKSSVKEERKMKPLEPKIIVKDRKNSNNIEKCDEVMEEHIDRENEIYDSDENGEIEFATTGNKSNTEDIVVKGERNPNQNSRINFKSSKKFITKHIHSLEIKGAKMAANLEIKADKLKQRMKNKAAVNSDIYDADEIVEDRVTDVVEDDGEDCPDDIYDGDEAVDTVSDITSVRSEEKRKSSLAYLSKKIRQLENKKYKLATSIIKKVSGAKDVAQNIRRKTKINDPQIKEDDINLHEGCEEPGDEIYDDDDEVGVDSVSTVSLCSRITETPNISHQQTNPPDSSKLIKKNLKYMASKASQPNSKKCTNQNKGCDKEEDENLHLSKVEDEENSDESFDDAMSEDSLTITYNLRNKFNAMSNKFEKKMKKGFKFNKNEKKVIVEVKVKTGEKKRPFDVEDDIYDSDQHEDEDKISTILDNVADIDQPIRKKSQMNMKSSMKYFNKQIQKMESKGRKVAANLESTAGKVKRHINDHLKDKYSTSDRDIVRKPIPINDIADEICDEDDRNDNRNVTQEKRRLSFGTKDQERCIERNMERTCQIEDTNESDVYDSDKHEEDGKLCMEKMRANEDCAEKKEKCVKKISSLNFKSSKKFITKHIHSIEMKGAKMAANLEIKADKLKERMNKKEGISTDIYDADEIVEDHVTDVVEDDGEDCPDDIYDGDEGVDTVSDMTSVRSEEKRKSSLKYLSKKIEQLENKKDKLATSIMKKVTGVKDAAQNIRMKSKINEPHVKKEEDNLDEGCKEPGDELYDDDDEVGVDSVSIVSLPSNIAETPDSSCQQTNRPESAKVANKILKYMTSKPNQSKSRKDGNEKKECDEIGQESTQECLSKAEDEGDSDESFDDAMSEDSITVAYNLRNKFNAMSDKFEKKMKKAFKIKEKEKKVSVEVKVKIEAKKKPIDEEDDIYDSDKHEDDDAVSDNLESVVAEDEHIQKKSHLNIKSKLKYINKQMQKIESKGKVVAASLESSVSKVKQQINDRFKDNTPIFEDLENVDSTVHCDIVDEIYDDDNDDRNEDKLCQPLDLKEKDDCSESNVASIGKLNLLSEVGGIEDEVYDSDENNEVIRDTNLEEQCKGVPVEASLTNAKNKSHRKFVSMKYINKQLKSLETKRQIIASNLDMTAQKLKKKISDKKDKNDEIYDADDIIVQRDNTYMANTWTEVRMDLQDDIDFSERKKEENPSKSSFINISKKIKKLKNTNAGVMSDIKRGLSDKNELTSSKEERTCVDNQDVYDDEDDEGSISNKDIIDEVYDDDDIVSTISMESKVSGLTSTTQCKTDCKVYKSGELGKTSKLDNHIEILDTICNSPSTLPKKSSHFSLKSSMNFINKQVQALDSKCSHKLKDICKGKEVKIEKVEMKAHFMVDDDDIYDDDDLIDDKEIKQIADSKGLEVDLRKVAEASEGANSFEEIYDEEDDGFGDKYVTNKYNEIKIPPKPNKKCVNEEVAVIDSKWQKAAAKKFSNLGVFVVKTKFRECSVPDGSVEVDNVYEGDEKETTQGSEQTNTNGTSVGLSDVASGSQTSSKLNTPNPFLETQLQNINIRKSFIKENLKSTYRNLRRDFVVVDDIYDEDGGGSGDGAQVKVIMDGKDKIKKADTEDSGSKIGTTTYNSGKASNESTTAGANTQISPMSPEKSFQCIKDRIKNYEKATKS